MSHKLTITATVLTEVVGDDTTPRGVLVHNTGNIPVEAVRSIAQQALADFAGGFPTVSGVTVAERYTWREVAEETNTIFDVVPLDTVATTR